MKDQFFDVLANLINTKIAAMNTSIPAKVESFDHSKRSISAQPLIKKKLKDGSFIRYPVITNVPVVFPSSSGFRMNWELKKGDGVLLLFSQQSIDLWLTKGGEVEPEDPRRYALSDAIAVPGLWSFDGSQPEVTEGVAEIVYEKELSIRAETIKFQGGGKQAARKSDAVQAIIPAGTVVVEVTGGSGAPAVGVKNATDIVLNGDIQEGSDSVEIGD